MPKLPKGFGRRKLSSATALEDFQNAPAGESTFRVFERPAEAHKSFDGGMKLAKAMGRPNSQPLFNEDNIFEESRENRGSGLSNSNTASTVGNSSRLSAASTIASSTESNNQNPWQSPHDKPFTDIPKPPLPKSSSVFSLKNAGRTFSFGRIKTTPSPSKALDDAPSPINPQDDGPLSRPRAVTNSSLASTVTPPKLDERELGLSLGGDFSDMFTGMDKRRSQTMNLEGNRSTTRSPDYYSNSPAMPPRTYGGSRAKQPSPLHIDRKMEIEVSPDTGASQNSTDMLMSTASPRFPPERNPPPVPQHRNSEPLLQEFDRSSYNRSQRPLTYFDGGRPMSDEVLLMNESAPHDAVHDDSRLFSEPISTVQSMDADSSRNARVRDSWSSPQTNAPQTNHNNHASESAAVPENRETDDYEDIMIDDQIAESADLAQRFNETLDEPPPLELPKNRVMTPAQFERYRQDQEKLKSVGGLSKQHENEDEDDVYEEEEDEAERHRRVAKQRRKQEAHMAVYRQQMMKVTGDAPAISLSRPSMPTSQSSPNLLGPGRIPDEEEEDEEVPLAILAAHGFPNKTRAPGQLSSSSSNPNLRSANQLSPYPPPARSISGDVASSRLPPFARKLPQDPYFGAGLVNPTTRETLSYGTGSPKGAPPGGLVGIIASEERSRAMRRGSPNTAGEYGPTGGFDNMLMPPHLQSPALMRGAAGGNITNAVPAPSVGEQAQIQIAQHMQQFMQIQMQFMQMQIQQTGGASSQSGHTPIAPTLPRSSTMTNLPPPTPPGRPATSQQRAMTTLDPNAAPWIQQSGQAPFLTLPHLPGANYAPSIAPSERSNIGQPGRYRPVTHIPTDKSRATTMSGALQDWNENKLASSTIKMVKKSGNLSDDDDEEGWEAMKRQREQKKSTWKSKKDVSSIIGF